MKDKNKYDNNAGNESESDNTEEPDKTPSNNSTAVTEKQLKRLYAMSHEVAVNEDTLKKIIVKHYNKNSAKDLTRKEYDFICKQLEEMINKQKNPA